MTSIPPALPGLVSLIVPVYRVEAFLPDCIESLLKQTHQNIEVILVEDGSPDCCGKICDRYARQDVRVRVIHKQNGGLSDARNAGIEASTGQYLSFIDGDDWIHPDYVATLLKMARDRRAQITVCNFVKVFPGQEPPSDPLDGEPDVEFSGLDAVRQYQGPLYVPMVVAWAKLYERALFHGIRFPVGRLHEDEFTTYRLFARADRVAYTPRPLLFYRQRPESIMGSRNTLRSRLDASDALLERGVFFKEAGVTDLANAAFRDAFYALREAAAICRREGMTGRHHCKPRIRKLRKHMRAGGFPMPFRLVFEMYFLAPGTFETLAHARRIVRQHLFPGFSKRQPWK